VAVRETEEHLPLNRPFCWTYLKLARLLAAEANVGKKGLPAPWDPWGLLATKGTTVKLGTEVYQSCNKPRDHLDLLTHQVPWDL
jgi:hypothetical protein